AIILRSCPILNERAGKIIDKEALTFNKANWGKYAGEAGLAKMMQDREKAKELPDQHRIAQLAARDVLKRRPETRTFFVLNLSDGKERFIAPAGYAAQHADVCPPPVALPDGRVISYYRGRWAAMKGVLFASRYMIDIGFLNFQTGLFERMGPYNSIPAPFGIRGDDNARLSVAGEMLMGNWGNAGGDRERGAGALDLRTKKRHSFGDFDKPRKFIRAGGTGDSACAPAITSDGTILLNRFGTHIVALESTGKGKR
ncbi:hypothetical protein LCGC14_3026730, partial [marine sediment metagenome]